MAGCKDIAIVSSENHLNSFEKLIGDGSQFGAEISFHSQTSANGIVGALQSAKNLNKDNSALVILGDNIFFGGGIGGSFKSLRDNNAAAIWVKKVHNPSDYGVLTLDDEDKPVEIVEKPKKPNSNLAITGLYYLPKGFINLLDKVEPSERNELEITDLINEFMKTNLLEVKHLSRGTAWFDAGTPERLFMAADYVRIIQERSGEIVGSPEEVSVRNGLLSIKSFKEVIKRMPESNYKESLLFFKADPII